MCDSCLDETTRNIAEFPTIFKSTIYKSWSKHGEQVFFVHSGCSILGFVGNFEERYISLTPFLFFLYLDKYRFENIEI